MDPIDGETSVRYYTVWVGGIPARIFQVESLSFQRTKALVKINHQTVAQGDEKWLLPEKVHVDLTYPEGAKNPDYLITNDKPVSGGLRKLDEMSGEGDISIVYADWRVNTGLDDGFFKDSKNR